MHIKNVLIATHVISRNHLPPSVEYKHLAHHDLFIPDHAFYIPSVVLAGVNLRVSSSTTALALSRFMFHDAATATV